MMVELQQKLQNVHYTKTCTVQRIAVIQSGHLPRQVHLSPQKKTSQKSMVSRNDVHNKVPE